MKLIIDFGNTLKKIAFFQNNKLIKLKNFKHLSLKQLTMLVEANKNIDSAIISSVIDYPVNYKQYLQSKFKFIELNESTPIPIINKYKTPKTLGNDRLAAAVAATNIFPDKNVLVIDVGTCITYDFINFKKEYLGGGISPGLTSRFKALHNFTNKLPLLNKKKFITLVGKNTQQSILSGVMNGAVAEIEGIIKLYKEKYPSLKIILSGGDSIYFDKRLKSNIFAFSNIVLFGLNIILRFNVEK